MDDKSEKKQPWLQIEDAVTVTKDGEVYTPDLIVEIVETKNRDDGGEAVTPRNP